MKRLQLGSMILLLLLCSSMVSASGYAPIIWDTTGVAIRQGYHIEWQRSAEIDADGNVIYTWSDTRTMDREVYAQKISPGGMKLWAADGIPIITHLGRQEDPSLIPTGFSDYIFIWKDLRDDTSKGDLYAQKIDANGNKMWDPEGILLSTGNFDEPAELRMVADGTGGAVIIWDDLRNGDEGDIYAIRILADGTIPAEWPSNGLPVVIAPAGQQQMTVDTDGAGGAIVAWRDARYSPTQGKDIYAQRVTIDAQLDWGSEAVIVCDTLLDQESPKLCPDGSGGAYIAWKDMRGDTQGDLYFQHVDNSGNLLFPEIQGKPLIVAVRQQESQRIVADGAGNAILVWRDTRNDPLQNLSGDIYGQKVNSSGQKLWNPAGVAVCTDPADQSEARLNADGSGNVICVWMDQRNGNENPKTNIFAQKINGNGTMAWTTDGVPVCEANGYQYFPLVRAAASYSLIGWGDERSGSKGIWYQKLDAAGAAELTVDGDTLAWGISGDASGARLVQDNSGKIFVLFLDQRFGNAGFSAYVQIVDTLGNTYLEKDGRPICPNPIYSLDKEQVFLDACSDGNQGAIAVWEDHRDSNPFAQIYAQRVLGDGTLQWGEAGIQVSPYNDQQLEPQVVADDAGGALVAWFAPSPTWDNNVYAARLSSSGSQIWSVQISSTPWEDEELEDLVPDGNGGAYISYHGGAWPDINVYGQHVDANGNLLWDPPVALCTEVGKQQSSRAAALPAGEALFVWTDERGPSLGDSARATDIYAQKVDASGQIVWQVNGIPVSMAAQDQYKLSVALDSDNNISIAWEDFRYAVNLDVYMQKMSPDGQMLYALNGIPVCTASGDQSTVRLMNDGQEGNFVFWSDFRAGSTSDIYATHLDGSGGLYSSDWTANGNIVSDYVNKQDNASITRDYVNGVVAVWEDKRSSGKDEVINLYAQRINERSTGVLAGEGNPTLPAAFQLFAPYPNPFNPSVRLRFQLQHPGAVRLAIYDLLGRQVVILSDKWLQAGVQEVTWNARAFASGIYVAKLEFENSQQEQKLLLLK